MAVAVRYPRWLSPVFSKSRARARCASVISLNVRPFRGNMSVGMKFHFKRSSESNANAARSRSSGVSDARNRVAADAMAAAERSEATTPPIRTATNPRETASLGDTNRRMISVLSFARSRADCSPSVASRVRKVDESPLDVDAHEPHVDPIADIDSVRPFNEHAFDRWIGHAHECALR